MPVRFGPAHCRVLLSAAVLAGACLVSLSGFSERQSTVAADEYRNVEPNATTVMPLRSDDSGLNATPYVSFLRDPAGTMSLDEIRATHATGQFQTTTRPWPQFGYTPDAIWIHVAFRSEASESDVWLVELRTARMDELDWYEVRGDGTVSHVAAGNLRPRDPRALDFKYPVFPLRLHPSESAEIFLRVRSQTSVHIPLTVWSPGRYAETRARGEALFASFFGYMSALILLSFVLSFSAGDRGYAIYSLSLIGLVVNYFITSGYYAWLRLPGTAWAVHGGTILAAESAALLMLIYVRFFFDLPREAPRLDRWVIRPLTGLTILLMAVLLFLSYRTAVQIMLWQALATGAFLMFVALVFWWRGNRIARFYFLGWVAFWFLFAWTVLLFRGVLPMPTLPEYPALISIALSMTLFFFAMADRIREMRRSVALSHARILALEQARQLDFQEQTRQQQQMIRDLHDGIGGLTANVGLLAEIGRRNADTEQSRGSFQRISELAAEGAAEIQGLMSSLETRDMPWPDFIVECRRLGETRLGAHGIAFDLSIQGDTSIPGPGAFAGQSLLRIFKEALTNALKHAEASQLRAKLTFEPSRFTMIIQDNGKGMTADPSGGRGLANMENRVRELGGRMTIRSENGTELIFEIPLPIKPPDRGIHE